MKILQVIKFATINLISFIALLLMINWGCGVYIKNSAQVSRDQLPNYAKNKLYAQAIFHDYNSVQHQYEPFVGWKTLPYKGKTLHIDSKGNRVHTPPQTDHNNSLSAAFFGGSTMWGEGSDDQHTIPALFNDKNPEYQVLNMGQLAYNSRQELDALITMYSKNVQPEIVFFYDGVNDAAFLCPTDIEDLPAHRLVPLFRSKLYVKKNAFIKELLYKSFVENILKLKTRYSTQSANNKSLYNCLGENGKAEVIAEIMMKNWEMAHEIVSARGGKFYAILQPAAFIGKPKTDHLKLDEALEENFKEVYKHIKLKILERKHNWIYDFSNSFDKDEFIYIDFCHVSPNGNEIIAERMTQMIKPIR